MKRSLAALALAIAVSAASPSAWAADSATDFYKGKQIFLQIGSSTAGSYNIVGRAVANHMAKHIPGNPTIVVQNNPNTMVLANNFGNTTPRDGTVFGLFVNGMPTIPLIDPGSAQYDTRKFSFLGSPTRESHLLVVGGNKIFTMEDVFTKETIVAGEAPGTAPTDYPRLTNALIGTKFKLVAGYQSSGERTLAMQRGEVDGQAGSSWSNVKISYKDMMAKKEIRVIGIFGFRKNPEIPDVPLFPLGKTAEDKQMFNLMYSRQAYGRPFVLPPDVPADRVAALRKAFDDTMKDPEFIAEAQKVGLDLDPVSYQELTDLTNELFATPKPVLEKMNKLVEFK
jgi:tripartite-type tricarboxylate transporter receptor subunit TctC